MASIAGIKGISYAPYRGGWKLRWRELHETESGVVRKARSHSPRPSSARTRARRAVGAFVFASTFAKNVRASE